MTRVRALRRSAHQMAASILRSMSRRPMCHFSFRRGHHIFEICRARPKRFNRTEKYNRLEKLPRRHDRMMMRPARAVFVRCAHRVFILRSSEAHFAAREPIAHLFGGRLAAFFSSNRLEAGNGR